MKYIPPFQGEEDDVYVDRNLSTGTAGSKVPAAFFNILQVELLNLIIAAGLEPSEEDLTQIAQAVLALAVGDDIVNQINTFTKAQRGAVEAVAYAGTLALDMSAANNFAVGALTGNITLEEPSNLVAGQSGSVTFIQDATGGRIITYNSIFKFANGVKPPLSTAPNAVDKLYYYVRSNAAIDCHLARGMN